MKPKPFIIDTDMALDDWMAILYLLKQPGIRVEAITVAATGEAHARPGVRNALRLLALADHEPIPVAAGGEKPQQGDHVFPWMIRFVMDHFFLLKAPKPVGEPSSLNAVDTIVQVLREAGEPVHIVALGPLTNLATVIREQPDLADTAVMYIKLHNFHWNIYGLQFKGVHEYLEALYDAFTENMDAIAELIRMHGEYPAASMAEYLKISNIKELPSEKIDIKTALSMVLEDLEYLDKEAKEIRLKANEVDAFDIVAMMEDHCTDYQKTIWFIRSMLVK